MSPAPSKRTDAWTTARRRRFLDALEETGNVTAAARAARVSRSSAYHLRARDADFAGAWDTVLNTAMDDVEHAIIARVLHGVERPVLYRGQVVTTVREYSDALSMFLLRRHRPEIYGTVRAAESAAGDADQRRSARDRMEQRLQEIAARRHDGSA